MPFARDGLREMFICTVVFGGGGLVCAWFAWHGSAWLWIPAIPLLAVWIFTMSFFRDPERIIPEEPGLLVSPADGRVTEVSHINSYDGVEGPALKISIFLSVFNVHVNRSPCAGRVLHTQYKPGEFLDARHADCGTRNESNTITILPTTSLTGPVIVKQIAGLIARRIICHATEGTTLARGQRLGMIKFGSRTDLIVPMQSGLQATVAVNDIVKGGTTILMRIVTP